MTSKWDHLPNAIHIDRVLASLKSNTSEWSNAFMSPGCRSYAGERSSAWDTAYSTVGEPTQVEIVLNSAYQGAFAVSCDGAYRGACDVMLALILYDDSAHLLDSTAEEIQVLIALGHPYAVLFLPAVIAFSNLIICP